MQSTIYGNEKSIRKTLKSTWLKGKQAGKFNYDA